MSRSYADGIPSRYAAEKLKLLRSRWESPIGAMLRRMSDVVFPAVPAEAFMGFTVISTSPGENTTEGVPGQRFHEVGLFQVEAGLRDGPAPNPDPDAEYNHWGALHDHELVRKLLARPAVMEPDAWKTRIADQIAVGLVNLQRHGINVTLALDGRIRPQDFSGDWFVRSMFTGFSRGTRQASRVLNRYADALAHVPEPGRWRELRRLVVEEARAGREAGAQTGRSGPAYAIVRTDQKMRSGWLLAGLAGGDRDWWTSEYALGDEDVEDTLARTAYGAGLPEEVPTEPGGGEDPSQEPPGA